MKLSRKQRNFLKASNDLISYGLSLGYEFTYGDCYRAKTCSHGHKLSTHREKLAIDLNLFVDGKYITSGGHPAWAILHNYWDQLGGSKRIIKDMNHFSFKHNGIR